jgi:ankyrin repeat protein
MKTLLATAAASAVLSMLAGEAATAGRIADPAPQASPVALSRLAADAPRLAMAVRADAESPVADAAMRGDLEAVRALVKQGADVNAAQGDGMTALHWAARKGELELVELLVYAGANPGAVTRNGAYTPLHLASQTGNAGVVRALLKAGANPDAHTSSGGATPLHFAAATGSAEAVRALLEGGADANIRETAWEQTPMMWAAAYNRPEVIRVLLQGGGDVAAISKVEDIGEREKKAREDERRREARMKALLAADQPARPAAADAPAGERPAGEAKAKGEGKAAEEKPRARARAEDGEDETREGSNAEVPLSYGELVGEKGGLTPLLFAVRQGHAEAVTALLEAGAEINQVSADNTTPLLMATINGHFDLARQLLERGADPRLASDAGATPLYAAINLQWAPKSLYPQPTAHKQQKTTYLELMEALLKAGADPNARLTKHLWYMEYNFSLLQVDTKGATPFWRAAYGTDVDAMKLLIRYGADPNIPTQKSPQRRFRRGAPEDDKDHSGLPPVPVGGPAVYPLHAASGVGFGEGYAANSHRSAPGGWLAAVKYLVEEIGVDINARDHNGYNAVHHAAARGDNELIEYLVEKGGDVKAVSRKGQTTADMANGPVQRVPPFLDTVKLLESLGSKNNNKCMSC